MPYERHHILLVELFDTLIKLFEDDEDFASFHLDGQTIPIEDYLQVRPEKRETIQKLVKAGKLHVGPWYVLQDEWLTSSEANIRNLLVGHAVAREFGDVCKVGYFPDSFGNMGQAPQILQQAGIDNSVFGRGVKPIGADNQVMSGYESNYSEMYWQSPNGSRVLGILFANWYHNGMEIPTDKETAKVWWRDRIAAVERFASSPQLLFMNGCDHQPVQTNLSEALRVARKLFPDIEFKHSNFPEYIAAVKSSTSESMNVIEGELRSQQTDGWWTLANTASARVYIKQENQLCQALLEKAAEPLAAIASKFGKEHPKHLLTYAWKTLMQNHPHDSICGCSADEVHREMMTRFAKSRRVAEGIVEESIKAITGHIDTIVADGTSGVPLVVFNTSGKERTGVVSIDVDVVRAYSGNDSAKLQEPKIDAYSLVDTSGRSIDAEIEDMGIGFGYDLPKDRFRQPYYARRFRVTFAAESVPSMGYRVYNLVEGREQVDLTAQELAENAQISSPAMENEYLVVTINVDGTLDVLDKRSGRMFRGLGAYEDTGDVGNEYIYKQSKDGVTLSTQGLKATITPKVMNSFRTVYEIVHEWQLPAEAVGLQEEIQRMVPFVHREAKRSTDFVPMTLVTTVTLEKGVPAVKVTTKLENNAKDHRLRVLFPSDVVTDHHLADSIFEVVARDNTPSKEWKNPSNCQHQQAFVNVNDERGGLTIANKGLNEYEVVPNRNTIAVTLLRCVGEIGDWGVFPTPEAQCLGDHSFKYSIIPHGSGDGLLDSYALAYQEQFPMLVVQAEVHHGELPSEHSFARIQGRGVELTAFKLAESGESLIVRCFNTTQNETTVAVEVSPKLQVTGVYRSNVLEEIQTVDAPVHAFGAELPVGPAEITTVVVK